MNIVILTAKCGLGTYIPAIYTYKYFCSKGVNTDFLVWEDFYKTNNDEISLLFQKNPRIAINKKSLFQQEIFLTDIMMSILHIYVSLASGIMNFWFNHKLKRVLLSTLSWMLIIRHCGFHKLKTRELIK